ncbi:MAG: hypothetical protein ACQGVC_12555 [Myxococcota bacterium]
MRTLGVLVALALAACTPSVTPIVDCSAHGDAEPLCGYQNPEDLALLPSGSALLVSEYGAMDRANPGRISRLDLRDHSRHLLFAPGDADGARPQPGWGDADCPGPPEGFSPHGIDLVERSDGTFALLVVNHAGRESVEFFEVTDPRGAAGLAWRGCAVPPAGAWLNDVVGRRDGGFLVSHMIPRRDGIGQLWEFLKADLLGRRTGHVLAWSADAGFARVPGSEASFANGVELSADETVLWVNANLGDRVFAVDLASGETLGEAEVTAPDNSTWAPDGRLFVASLTAPIGELLACGEVTEGSCPAAFAIVAIDPATFESEPVYTGDGVTMGAGTVGLRVGDALYVGSFAGDRILRVRLAAEGS